MREGQRDILLAEEVFYEALSRLEKRDARRATYPRIFASQKDWNYRLIPPVESNTAVVVTLVCSCAMAVRSFLEVPTQDVARSPLLEGQTLPNLCVFGLLAVLKRKPDGVDVWNNFDKAAKAKGSDGESLLASEGVEAMRAKVMGKPKARRVVAPEKVPLFLAVVCGRQALPSLEGADLLETLVARGVDRGRAKDLLTEQAQKLQENPEDVATLTQVSQVFGTPLGAVRHMRTPKRNGEGTVFVMGAIDLVMAARGCDYNTAKMIIFRVFKDYYKVDLDSENPGGNEVNEGTSRTLIHKVRFFTGERGGQASLALDVQGAGELLCVIPGSDFGAAVRRRAVDALLRVEGGDESLIDRIKANRRFQEYLAQHDPDHPLRAVGEHAKRRQVEEAVPEVHRRAEMELVFGHKKRMLELEHAAKERSKVFGADVKEAMRSLFPDYDVSARTNRSVDGRDREPHLYFEAHLGICPARLPASVAELRGESFAGARRRAEP